MFYIFSLSQISEKEFFQNDLFSAPKSGFSGGAHGFDPNAPEMRALFLAAGPDFLTGMKIGVFDNVDVYSLIMKLLKLPAEPNDGSLEPVRAALKSEPSP